DHDPDLKKMVSFLIQAALFSEGGIPTQQLNTLFHDSPYIVRKLLKQIPPALLVCEQRGKRKYYQLNLTALEPLLQNEQGLPDQ
ncbi:MAG: hypothetical protein IJF59_04155, partial [Clostridia bacterium]|nr:hypothetical protein [Clostridia bacterium]